MKCIRCTEPHLSTIADFSFFWKYFLGAQTSISLQNALVTAMLYENDENDKNVLPSVGMIKNAVFLAKLLQGSYASTVI